MTLDELVHLAHCRLGITDLLPAAVETAQKVRSYAETGQGTLFGDEPQDSAATLAEPREAKWLTEGGSEADRVRRKRALVLDMLRQEREVLGVCMTADPLSMYAEATAQINGLVSIAELMRCDVGQEAALAVYATAVQRHTTKAGKPFMRFNAEDGTGQLNCVMWSEAAVKFGELLGENVAVAVRCNLDEYNGEAQLVVWKIKLLESFK